MANKFTQKAENTLSNALALAKELGHSYIGTEHLLVALASEKDSISSRILTAKGVDASKLRQSVIDYVGLGNLSCLSADDMTPRLRKILEYASDEVSRAGAKYVGTEHLLTALVNQRDCVGARLLEAEGIPLSELKTELSTYLGSSPTRSSSKQSEEDAKKAKRSALRLYGKDLSAIAESGGIDPVIGREEETERLIRILCRRQKNNPCVIGDPGVGKTAIVEGLAQRIAEGRVPADLAEKRIISLDVPSMIAGAKYRGEFEERMKSVIEETKKDARVILFIDEAHILVGAGAAEGAVDAANILKPPLARGELRVICATTPEEYRMHIEKDAALERRLQPLRIKEPTESEAIGILSGLKQSYEAHHGITISEGAIRAAVRLSARYIHDRYLPDKAIDLLDEAAAKLKISQAEESDQDNKDICKLLERQKEEALIEGDLDVAYDIGRRQKELSAKASSALALRADERATLEEKHIADLLTEQTGIPCGDLLQSEGHRLRRLEDELSRSVVGQESAVMAVANAIRRSRTGLSPKNRPIGSFLFLGSTGVGKTELCRALALALFESKDAMLRLDMSEYMEKHSTSKLIGSPPGYVGYGEGGILTERIRRRPYSVILLDEIEKAHPDVLNILLQILEDGILTDSTGRRVDFSSTIVIMTSNLISESEAERRVLGFSEDKCEDSSADELRTSKKLRETFRPELLNRIDEIVLFSRLGEAELRAIADIMLSDLCERSLEVGVRLEIADGVSDYLAQKCLLKNRDLGARSLRREITDAIETPLSQLILSRSPELIRVNAVPDGISLEVC